MKNIKNVIKVNEVSEYESKYTVIWKYPIAIQQDFKSVALMSISRFIPDKYNWTKQTIF